MENFKIESDGRVYSESMSVWNQNTPLGYYPRILDAANALMELSKTFDQAQKDDTDPITKFHDGIYPLAIVLEIDGEPMGVVRLVEDFVTWIPFRVENRDSDSS